MNTKQAPYSVGMIICTILLAFALVNQILVNFGYSPLPFEDAQVEFAVSSILTAATAVWAWWKNNDLTYKARRNTKFLKDKGYK